MVLINDCLMNILIFCHGLYLLRDGTYVKLDKARSILFWGKEGGRQTYHMVKWEHICSLRKMGALE